MESFILYALVAGIGVALLSGPLGCFLIWQRLAFFSDTLAHSALLGIGISLWFHLNPLWGIFLVTLIIAFLLTITRHKKILIHDGFLNLLSTTSLSLGLILISVNPGVQSNLMTYLFGDILTITFKDIILIYCMGGIFLTVIWIFWRPLLAVTVDPDLAVIHKIPIIKIRLLFMVMIAITIAVAIQIMGIILITALFIIPAMVARYFSSSPEKMVLLATLIGIFVVIGGLILSFYLDWPAAPSMVLMATTFFAVGSISNYLNFKISA
ncbi:MAG: metal ABC transporter permease [Alphaproteobacteria bacterium]|nr:metal ABC transporter permease [Alphaproteobacteria bacterium]